MNRNLLLKKLSIAKNQSKAFINDTEHQSLLGKRFAKIKSLIAKGENYKKGSYLYFALLCNSIVEVIIRRIVVISLLIEEDKNENEILNNLLDIAKNHRYISDSTHERCIHINKFRNTIHINHKKDYSIIYKSNYSILTVCQFLEDVNKNYEKILVNRITIINIIGGCDLYNSSDIALLNKYKINIDSTKEEFKDHIDNGKLVLIPNYDVDTAKYQNCFKSLIKEILLREEENNNYSDLICVGIITAAKELRIDEKSIVSWMLSDKFNYECFKKIRRALYVNYPEAYKIFINNCIERKPYIFQKHQDIDFDFACFLISYSNDKNISLILEMLIKIYGITNRPEIPEMITDVLCPFCPQTSASTSKRISAIKFLINNSSNRDLAYSILIELLPHKKSTCSGYSDIHGNSFEPEITVNELKNQYSKYQKFALKYSNSSKRLSLLATNLKYLYPDYVEKFIDIYKDDNSIGEIATEMYCSVYNFAHDSHTMPSLEEKLSVVLISKKEKFNFSNDDLFKYIFGNEHIDRKVRIQFLKDLEQEHLFSTLTSFATLIDQISNLGSLLSDYKKDLSDNDISEIMNCILSNNEKGKNLISSYLTYSNDNLTETIIQKISKHSEEDRVKFLCVAPITNFTLSELSKLSPDSQQYFWENRADFLNRFNLLSPENRTYVLNSLIKYSRPYAFLTILNTFSYRKDFLDDNLFLKAIELLPSSNEYIPNPNNEYSLIDFAIGYIKSRPKSDKNDRALKYLEEKSNNLFNETCRLCKQG